MGRKRRKKHKAKGCMLVFLSIILGMIFVHFAWQHWNTFVTSSQNATDDVVDIEENSYDWNRLTTDEKGRKYYWNEANVASEVGIDVSKYQGDIDWQKVKQDGIQFAMIRLGYRGSDNGKMMLDEKFEQNVKQATDAGIKVGVYFFSQAITEKEAIQEAKFVLEHTKKYSIAYPFVFDMEKFGSEENRIDALTVEQRTDITCAFCDTIQASGKKAMIYGGNSWLFCQLDIEKIQPYELWIAEYSETPSYPYHFQIWQYCDHGVVDGISTNVDLNVSFYDNSLKK